MPFGVDLPQEIPPFMSNEQSAPVQSRTRFSVIGKGISAISELAKRIHSFALDLIAVAVLVPSQVISMCTTSNEIKKRPNHDMPGVFCVHGFLGDRAHMASIKKNLADKEIENLYSVSCGSPFQSIEEQAGVLRAMIKDYLGSEEDPISSRGNKNIVLVGHSMGGLVIDAYKKLYAKEDGVTVLDTITIGTPITGTPVAYLAALFSRAARQMLPSSDFSKSRVMDVINHSKDKHGNKVSEHISINKEGIKITYRKIIMNKKNINNSGPKSITVIEQTITENPKTQKITTDITTRKKDESFQIKRYEKSMAPIEQPKILHIGSKHDTIVPYESSVSAAHDYVLDKEGNKIFESSYIEGNVKTTLTKKINNEGKLLESKETREDFSNKPGTEPVHSGVSIATQESGGHGWQLYSPAIHATVFSRVSETIKAFREKLLMNSNSKSPPPQ